jgi:hypothetical protein
MDTNLFVWQRIIMLDPGGGIHTMGGEIE